MQRHAGDAPWTPVIGQPWIGCRDVVPSGVAGVDAICRAVPALCAHVGAELHAAVARVRLHQCDVHRSGAHGATRGGHRRQPFFRSQRAVPPAITPCATRRARHGPTRAGRYLQLCRTRGDCQGRAHMPLEPARIQPARQHIPGELRSAMPRHSCAPSDISDMRTARRIPTRCRRVAKFRNWRASFSIPA